MFCGHFSTAVKDLLALPFAFWRKGSGPGQPLWLTGGWGGHRRGWLCLIPSQTAGVVSLLPFPCCRLAGCIQGSDFAGRRKVAQLPSPRGGACGPAALSWCQGGSPSSAGVWCLGLVAAGSWRVSGI